VETPARELKRAGGYRGSFRMEYLIRKTGAKVKAHIWQGSDTACRMASTGGLKRSRFEIRTDRGEHEICQMCAATQKKHAFSSGVGCSGGV